MCKCNILQMNLNKANGIKTTLFLAFKGDKMQYNKQDKTVRFLKNINFLNKPLNEGGIE